MNGTNFVKSLQIASGRTAPAGWNFAGLNDLNDDSHADIIWRQPDGRLGLWTLNGTNFVSTVSLRKGPPAREWRLIGVR